MEEIRRLVAAIGLPDFRYYAFPAVEFVPLQASRPTPTLSPITESGVEAATNKLQCLDVVLAIAEVVATRSQPMTTPVVARYPLLAEVVEAVSSPQPTPLSSNSSATIWITAQALSKPTRRRPRSAGRAGVGRP